MLKDIIENYKSKAGKTETVNIRCKFCGQFLITEAMPDMVNNTELLEELAIETCECKEAEISTKKKQRAERIEEQLTQCIGEDSNNPVEAEIYSVIKDTANLVCFGKMEKATFKLTGTDKVTLRTDSQGRLHIDREKKNKTTRTI